MKKSRVFLAFIILSLIFIDANSSLISQGNMQSQQITQTNSILNLNTNNQNKIDFVSTKSTGTTQNQNLVISSGLKQRILLYDSFKTRDTAISNIGIQNINYIFKSIPAIFTNNVSKETIPKIGLIDSVDFRNNFATQADITPIDQLVSGTITLSQTEKLLGIDQLHNIGLSGQGQTIAILDTGIGKNLITFNNSTGQSRITYMVAPSLAKTLNTNAYDQDGHGSHVAGIAAGNGQYTLDGKSYTTDNIGMAPDAHIISIRVLDATGKAPNSWIAEGIDMALQTNASVISMSLSTNLYQGENDIFRTLGLAAQAKGKLIVAAAGNDGPMGSGIGIPGGLESVIGVGAYDNTKNQVWQFSAMGPGVGNYVGPDLVAPGVDIASVDFKTGFITELTGTSMATPHVAGGILLLKQAFPNATIFQIRQALLATATDLNAAVEIQGRGLVNFAAAYNYLNTITNPSLLLKDVVATPNRISDNNIFLRSRISFVKKELPMYLYSYSNLTVQSHIDTNYNHNVLLEIPSELNLTQGLNEYYVNVTVISNSVTSDWGRFYFTDKSNNVILYHANVTFSTINTFKSGKILFDIAHDFSTPSNYFANHGPQGEFSILSSILEDNGFIIQENQQTITTSLLNNFDLLFIANPNKNFNSSEITAIHNFVLNDGKSVLFIAGGGLLEAENFTFSNFDIQTINNLLDFASIGVKVSGSNSTTPVSINDCSSVESPNRISKCPRNAVISRSQPILNPSFAFANFGPELEVKSKNNNILNSYTVAYQSGKPVVVASEFKNHGKIMLFSSPLLFDNIGVTTDYVGKGNNLDNIQIAEDSINWLLESRAIKTNYYINNKLSSNSNTVYLHESTEIKLNIVTPDGKRIDLGNSVEIRVLQYDLSNLYSYNITATKNSAGDYVFTLKFDSFGYYDFFLPVSYGKFIPTNSHFSVSADLYLYETQNNIRLMSTIIFILILISWILWLYNEGGRKKFHKEK